MEINLAKKVKEKIEIEIVKPTDTTELNDELTKAGFAIVDVEKDSYNIEDVEYWASTGSLVIDAGITNCYKKDGKFYGGVFPKGIIEIAGQNSVGKSIVAGTILKNFQNVNAVCAYIDAENAVNVPFFKQCGVSFDKSKLIYSETNIIEEAFETVEKIVEKLINSKNPKKLGCIVVDSVASLQSKEDTEKKYDDTGYRTAVAKQMSLGLKRLVPQLRKSNIALIFTNQLRANMQRKTPFDDQWVTPAGTALPFYADIRWRLLKGKKLVNVKKQQIGSTIKFVNKKNRFGPPPTDQEVYLYYGRGIDDDATWYNFLKDHKYISQREPDMTIKTDQFIEKIPIKSWKRWLVDNPDKREILKQLILDEIFIDLSSDDLYSETMDEAIASITDDEVKPDETEELLLD